MKLVTTWTARGVLLGAMGGVAALGCNGAAGEPDGDVEGADQAAGAEDVGTAAQKLQQCVTIRRGEAGDVSDTFLSGDYPGWATGSEGSAYVGLSSGGNQNQALFAFDLSPIPAGSTVASASFSVYASWSPNNTAVDVHRVLVPWSEASTNAGNFPQNGFEAAPIASFLAGDGGFKSADVTALVQGWVDGSIVAHGIGLQETAGYSHLFFTSEAGPDRAPSLTVCYEPPPVPVSVGVGSLHACALLDDGQVKCWGNNSYGQLGYGDSVMVSRGDGAGEMGAALPAVNLGTGRTAVALKVGAQRSCAILDTGAVKCWGRNAGGALGIGDNLNRGDHPGEMGDALPAVSLGTGNVAVALAIGLDQTCALLGSGQVKCWGGNSAGALGLGDTAHRGDQAGEMGDALPYVDLGAGRTAVSLVAGAQHTCAVLDDASVKCWGYNINGQLGQGHTAFIGNEAGQMGALQPIDLGTGITAQAVAAGTFFTCAIVSGGGVKCWGDGYHGQLGQGDKVSRGGNAGEMGDALPYVDLGTGRTAVKLVAGATHACAVLDNGQTRCWGYNYHGQLGQGDVASRGDNAGEMGDLLAAVDLGSGRQAVAVEAGGNATCALLDSDQVKCWGRNFNGQLGLGDVASRGDNAGEMGDALPAVKLGAAD